MKQLLLILAAVVLVGCGKKDLSEPQAKKPETPKAGANETTVPKIHPKEEAKNPQPSKAIPANIDDPILEKAIREQLEKPEGELTKADLEKVTRLELDDNQLTELPKGLEKLTKLEVLILADNQLTDVKGLEKLTQLTYLSLVGNQLTDVKGLENLTQLKHLNLNDNPALTKAQIDELQKALPNCDIDHNAK